jgi:archaellum biogenesis ATPase FlaH
MKRLIKKSSNQQLTQLSDQLKITINDFLQKAQNAEKILPKLISEYRNKHKDMPGFDGLNRFTYLSQRDIQALNNLVNKLNEIAGSLPEETQNQNNEQLTLGPK